MGSQVFSYQSPVYFDELDALGILHHSRYLHHLERAQQAFFQELLGVPDFDAARDEDIYVVVHGLSIRFREPVRQPQDIVVDYRVQKIRAGGLTLDFVIRSVDGGMVYCSGERTVCKLSGQTHRPAPWSGAFRAALEKW